MVNIPYIPASSNRDLLIPKLNGGHVFSPGKGHGYGSKGGHGLKNLVEFDFLEV